MISFFLVIFLAWPPYVSTLTRFLLMPGLTSWCCSLRLLASCNRGCGWSKCGPRCGAWLLALRLGYNRVINNILAMGHRFTAAGHRPNTVFNLMIVCRHLLDLFCLWPAGGTRRVGALVALARNFGGHSARQTLWPLADWRLCDAVGGRLSCGWCRFYSSI